MPWGWGELRIDDNPRSAPYHLVWARDLYQIATALLAAGDTAGANRALDFLFEHQQREDGSFPQNPQVDGSAKWRALQMDQVGLPIVLAWQLGRTEPRTGSGSARRRTSSSTRARSSEQERWENQDGYSPATIAAQIAGLVCAADIATRNKGHQARRALPRRGGLLAAERRALDGDVQRPLHREPYYLRVTKDRRPERRHEVRDRRRRPVRSRPAPGGRRRLPRAGPAGRQASRTTPRS